MATDARTAHRRVRWVAAGLLTRVDRARLEKLLTEHDPFTSNT